MKSDDQRSGRVALVADGVLNPEGNQPDLITLLVERGWGIIALPPERLGRPAITQWMTGVADQVSEFQRHGMTVVAVLDGEETTVIGELERACATGGARPAPALMVSDSSVASVDAFLVRHARDSSRSP